MGFGVCWVIEICVGLDDIYACDRTYENLKVNWLIFKKIILCQ